jgi:hypothetical protein
MVPENEPVITQCYGDSGGVGTAAGSDVGNLVYETGIAVSAADEISVYKTTAVGEDFELTVATDYSVEVVAGYAVVSFVAAPVAADVLTFIRRSSIEQALNLQYNERLPSALIERQFDKLVRMIADTAYPVALRYPATENFSTDPSPTQFPARAERGNKVLSFNTTGKLEFLSYGSLAAAMDATFSANEEAIGDATAAGLALLEAANAAAQRTALGLGSAALAESVIFAPAADQAGYAAYREGLLTIGAWTDAGGYANVKFPLLNDNAAAGSKAASVSLTALLAIMAADIVAKSTLTFTGQLTLSNQTAAAAGSAMTRALHDTRVTANVGDRVAAVLATDGSAIISSTTYTDAGVSITLPAGTYEITGALHITNVNANAGMKCKGVFTGGSYTELRGRSFMWNGTTAPASALTSAFISGEHTIATAAAPSREISGVIVVAVQTALKWQFAQNSSNANNTTPIAGSYLCARRIA